MDTLTQAQVDACIKKAVPHIAEHIISKAKMNNGFSDNPRAIHPCTKVLTLGLDVATRSAIEDALISISPQDPNKSISQIAFIKACMQSITAFTIKDLLGESDETEHVWYSLEECSRDGALFLASIQTMNNEMRAACETVVLHYA